MTAPDSAWMSCAAEDSSMVPISRRKLYALALRDYWSAGRKALRGYLGRRLFRSQELVSAVYERHWELDNQAYVAYRDRRRDLFREGGRFIYADGWFIVRRYVDILTRIIGQLQAGSVLEVGAGRGKNLVLLALRRPDRSYAGLELTRQGVLQSRLLARDPPQKYLEVAELGDLSSLTEEHRRALEGIDFRQGSALEMPFADQSFDLSFTCLVLEQLPREFPQVLREMRRVTRKHCVFIEAFREANSLLGRGYLRSMDYFRSSYRQFARHGLEPIYFSTKMPQKLRYRTGLLIARAV